MLGRRIFFAVLIFGILSHLRAQDLNRLQPLNPASGIPKPLFLKTRDKIPPLSSAHSPYPPLKSSDGSALQAVEVNDLPGVSVMADLASPPVLSQIERLNRKETKPRRYYWHQSTVWDFCHTKDPLGNHWYGWKTGSSFHWVLFHGQNFWWHDEIAGRWIYFYKGCWWWPDDRDPAKVQVRLENGHYYLCDADGNLGADMSENGEPLADNLPVSLGGGSHPGHVQLDKHSIGENKAPAE